MATTSFTSKYAWNSYIYDDTFPTQDKHDNCGENDSKDDKLHAYGMSYKNGKFIVICNDDFHVPYNLFISINGIEIPSLSFDVFRDRRDILRKLTVNEYFLLGKVLKSHGYFFNKKNGTLKDIR